MVRLKQTPKNVLDRPNAEPKDRKGLNEPKDKLTRQLTKLVLQSFLLGRYLIVLAGKSVPHPSCIGSQLPMIFQQLRE